MIKEIADRISIKDCLELFKDADLSQLAKDASAAKRKISGNKVFYNQNIHVEPSNICLYKCKFCSFRKEEEMGYKLDIEGVIQRIKEKYSAEITEVHITGSVQPDYAFSYMLELLQAISAAYPAVHIKAFSAIELAYVLDNEGIEYRAGMRALKTAGLGSLPGGGAEIFHPELRKKICPDKPDGDTWLAIHEAAHLEGIPSNATMMFGHIENYEHRVHHMEKIRKLQDKTHGFNAFIPLTYLPFNNPLEVSSRVSTTEIMRNYAVSRLFLDNIPHLKAYWPMLGKELAQMSLLFGVDDLDGTINNTTEIYSEAGSSEQSPILSVSEIKSMAASANYEAIERNSLYNF